MQAGIFDSIVLGFVSAIGGGIVALNQYSLLILGFCAFVAYCSTMWPLVLSGGEALGPVLLMAIRIGIFYWICAGFAAMSFAAFDSFLTWGVAPSGGAFSAASFLKPSSIVDLGFRAARPIEMSLMRMGGWTGSWIPAFVMYTLAKIVIIVAFALVALHLMMTIIEFHLAVMVGAVLFPWGVLAQTAFLCEFAVSWIVAGLIRVLLTAAIMSVSLPLFETLKFTETPGGDPTLYSATIFALTAGVFAILAWQLPKRAAQVGGRGMALAMGGELLARGAQTAYLGTRAALTGSVAMGQIGVSAVRGASRLLQAARGGP
jgi:type IV secretion system protein TrbL